MTRNVQLMMGLSVNETFIDSKSVWVAVILLLLLKSSRIVGKSVELRVA